MVITMKQLRVVNKGGICLHLCNMCVRFRQSAVLVMIDYVYINLLMSEHFLVVLLHRHVHIVGRNFPRKRD